MSTFVKIAATTFAAFVFLLVLWPALSGLMKSAGKTGECNWNLFLAALTKQVTMGFAEIPVGCQAEYTTVDSDMLSKLHRLANKRITKYHSIAPPEESGYVGLAAATPTEYYLEASKRFHLSGTRPSYDSLNEWAVDSIIGKKLQQCNDKVWHGKLNIVERYFGSQRVFCVVCSVVSFSEDIPVSLKPSVTPKIPSLYEWMNVEPYYKTTYYDYIFGDATYVPLTKEQLEYSTQDPIAVVYVEQWVSTLTLVWKPVVAALAVGGALVATVATGGLATAAAGMAAYIAVRALQSDSDAPVKMIGLQSYSTLQAPPENGGLACTDIIA